ncbi:hypothetical protein [Streptomyces alboflavus]|uniref:hypothetical protein n=1 Tax=Streptomyces alboflavus TaxID=67267 RepID=UPI00368C4977
MVQAQTLSAWGSFTASGIALYIAWLNGRRDHRARLRAERAEARQVLVEYAGRYPGIIVTNRTMLAVTGLFVVEVAGESDTTADRVQVAGAPFHNDRVTLQPGQSEHFKINWRVENTSTDKSLLTGIKISQVKIAYRDGRGVR